MIRKNPKGNTLCAIRKCKKNLFSYENSADEVSENVIGDPDYYDSNDIAFNESFLESSRVIEIVGELPGTSGNNNPATPQNNPSFSVNSSNNESCQNTGSVNKRKPVEKLGRVGVRKVAT